LCVGTQPKNYIIERERERERERGRLAYEREAE